MEYAKFIPHINSQPNSHGLIPIAGQTFAKAPTSVSTITKLWVTCVINQKIITVPKMKTDGGKLPARGIKKPVIFAMIPTSGSFINAAKDKVDTTRNRISQDKPTSANFPVLIHGLPSLSRIIKITANNNTDTPCKPKSLQNVANAVPGRKLGIPIMIIIAAIIPIPNFACEVNTTVFAFS